MPARRRLRRRPAGQAAAAAGRRGSGGTTGGGGTTGDGACADVPIPAIACAVGRTVPVCTTDATGRRRSGRSPARTIRRATAARRWWQRRRGWRQRRRRAGGRRRRCSRAPSSGSCAAGEVCTTEDGVCNAPPGCGAAASPVPAVCYGNCRPAKDGPACGTVRCAAGMVCCNDSCGICTPPNGGCTKQICVPPGGRVRADADCRWRRTTARAVTAARSPRTRSFPSCRARAWLASSIRAASKKAQCVNGACAWSRHEVVAGSSLR